MTLQLYNNTSESTKAVKNLIEIGTAEGTLRAPTDILNPTIRLPWSTGQSIPWNYCYIPEFRRYYFVVSMTAFSMNLIDVTMHVDVLSTYWDFVKELDCVVSRNEYKRTNDLVDQEIWFTADSLYKSYQIPYSSSSESIFTTVPSKHCVLVVQGPD